MNKGLLVGYHSMPDHNNRGDGIASWVEARQLVLFNQLRAEKLINGNEWHKFHPEPDEIEQWYWITRTRITNDAKSAYINSIAEKLLAEGKIYSDIENLAKGIVERSKTNEGSVTYISTGLAMAIGFAVPFNKRFAEASIDGLTAELIKDFVEDYYYAFLRQDSFFLSTWFKNRKWCLGVSSVVLYEKTAIEIAKKDGVETIYDISNKKVIHVDG